MTRNALAFWVLLIVFQLQGHSRMAQAQPAPRADTIFHNGRIMTMADARPLAAAIAIRGEHILGVGSFEELKPLAGAQTRTYDLNGRTVIPGINDTHIHVRDLGFDQSNSVNLIEGARSIALVQRLLRERLEQLRKDGRLGRWTYPTTGETGPWLFGNSWTQDRLVEKRMTNRHELDAVSRDIPISLVRLYNGIAVNTKVFELLGIRFGDPTTYPDWFKKDPPNLPPGDVIFRDRESGLPDGVFLGTEAPRLVAKAIPSKTFEQQVDSLVSGLKVLASFGVTSIVEAGSQIGRVTKAYQAARAAGPLPLRVTIYDGWYRSGDPEGLGDPKAIAERAKLLGSPNTGDRMFRVRGIKSSADGGVGSRSAALSVPYLPSAADRLGRSNSGVLRDPDTEYRFKQFEPLAEHGWEIHTHACGDVAIRQTMDVYRRLLDRIKAKNPAADPRWSIIHNYLPNEPGTSVIKEMADYGVIAAIQPAFLYYQGDSFLANLGPERMARHTPFQTFLKAGILMAYGSDYPSNSADPWAGLYAMRTRKDQITGRAFGPEERLSMQDALEVMTINGAYLTFDERERGSLEAGKLADLVVIDADLANARDEDLPTMASKVVLTMVGGRIVHQRQGFTLTTAR